MRGTASIAGKVTGSVSEVLNVSGRLTIPDAAERPAYDGDYAVAPSDEAQTLETRGKRMTDNVVIAPIPPNYGKITWNGSYLTVS